MMAGVGFGRMDGNVGPLSTGKFVECRICHDEDEDSNMETPCSCRGSLKYSHRACVQRWCNEKGDTNCEICHQQFKPGYTSSSPLLSYDGHTSNQRRDWEVLRSEFNNNHLIPTISSENMYLDPNFDDYSMLTSGSLMCCRVVTVIFVVLLVLRHTLPLVVYGPDGYSISWAMLLMLQTVGILLPIYVMVKAFIAVQRRQSYQRGSLALPSDSSDEENEVQNYHQHSYFIRV